LSGKEEGEEKAEDWWLLDQVRRKNKSYSKTMPVENHIKSQIDTTGILAMPIFNELWPV
jgi:hypothetical protein